MKDFNSLFKSQTILAQYSWFNMLQDFKTVIQCNWAIYHEACHRKYLFKDDAIHNKAMIQGSGWSFEFSEQNEQLNYYFKHLLIIWSFDLYVNADLTTGQYDWKCSAWSTTRVKKKTLSETSVINRVTFTILHSPWLPNIWNSVDCQIQ